MRYVDKNLFKGKTFVDFSDIIIEVITIFGGNEGKKRDYVNNDKIDRVVKDLNILDPCLYLCTKQTGSCLTVLSTTVTGKVLSAMEFRFFL